MSNILQIHSTTKYNNFQHYTSNRSVMEKHVETFVNDKTFPEKFKTSPIVVNKDFYIIDGQHRFEAAKRLMIPIFYIIDDNATEADIRIRNSQSHNWCHADYVKHFTDLGSKSYKVINDLKEKHGIPLTYLNSIIVKLCNLRQLQYSYDFKKGTLNIEKYISDLTTLCDILFPELKKVRNSRGVHECRPLFTCSYLYGYAHYYRNDMATLWKFLEKIFIYGHPFPYCGSFEQGREQILKIASWKPPKDKKEK